MNCTLCGTPARVLGPGDTLTAEDGSSGILPGSAYVPGCDCLADFTPGLPDLPDLPDLELPR